MRAVSWQPGKTVPPRTRVLVVNDKGQVRIARRIALRWYDDADMMLDTQAGWMPLPHAPSEQPKPKPRGRRAH
jgi:hypothetical protein